MRAIVGLGNPGVKYKGTRHNLGFFVIEKLARKCQSIFKISSQYKALVAEGQIESEDVIWILPLNYMNNSGVVVNQILLEKNIKVEDILVVTDDFNLDFGKIRIRAKGSDGGHNGLRSIILHLETEIFSRLRLGIGLPSKNKITADYVLEKFTAKERAKIDLFADEAIDCCVVWIKEGIAKAMEQYNKKGII